MRNESSVRRAPGRPPKLGRSNLPTRDMLVRSGVEILTEKGFNSTGIDEVLRRVGVPKGSFYHYFSSKDDFGLAVIDEYAAYFARKLDRSLLRVERAPLDRIRDFVADAGDGMRRYGFRRGCLVGNLGQEMGALNDAYRERLDAVLCDWEGRLAVCLNAARHAGQIAGHADCARLAAYFWIGWEGAVLRAKLVRSAAPLELFADAFFAGLPR